MKQQVMKAGNLLATAYMLIMFVLYPFYMKNGYADLGEHQKTAGVSGG